VPAAACTAVIAIPASCPGGCRPARRCHRILRSFCPSQPTRFPRQGPASRNNPNRTTSGSFQRSATAFVQAPMLQKFLCGAVSFIPARLSCLSSGRSDIRSFSGENSRNLHALRLAKKLLQNPILTSLCSYVQKFGGRRRCRARLAFPHESHTCKLRLR
jgi:hypothetical protein